MGVIHAHGAWRTASEVGLVVVTAYVALRLPRTVRDAARVAAVGLVIAFLIWPVLLPHKLPVADWKDWPRDWAGWLGADDGRWLRWGVGVTALLVIGWFGSRLRLRRRERALRSLRRSAAQPGWIATTRRVATGRTMSATGSVALRIAHWTGASATPASVDAKQFEYRLASSRNTGAIPIVRRTMRAFTERNARVEYVGTPAQPIASVSWPDAVGTGGAGMTLAVAVDCEGHLIVEPDADRPTGTSDSVRAAFDDLMSQFAAERDSSTCVIDLTRIPEARAPELVDLVMRIATPAP
jgi:hypothetical protein